MSGSRDWVGLGAVVAANTVTVVKSVFEGALVQHVSPEFVALNCFFIAHLWYALSYRGTPSLSTVFRSNVGDLIGLNITTTFSWLGYLYALVVFEPAISSSIIIGLLPALTVLLGRWFRPHVAIVPLEMISSVGILGSMAFLAVVAWHGASGTGAMSTTEFVLGLVACVVTATAVAGNTYYTKRLSEAGVTVRQMMATRFPLLILSTGVIVLVRGSGQAYTPALLGSFLLLALVGVILGLHLMQFGITRTEPMTVSLLFGVSSVLVYVIQLFDPRLEQSLATLVGVLAFTVFVLLGVAARFRVEQPGAREPSSASAATKPDRGRDTGGGGDAGAAAAEGAVAEVATTRVVDPDQNDEPVGVRDSKPAPN